jgi:hypothetical protein
MQKMNVLQKGTKTDRRAKPTLPHSPIPKGWSKPTGSKTEDELQLEKHVDASGAGPVFRPRRRVWAPIAYCLLKQSQILRASGPRYSILENGKLTNVENVACISKKMSSNLVGALLLFFPKLDMSNQKFVQLAILNILNKNFKLFKYITSLIFTIHFV